MISVVTSVVAEDSVSDGGEGLSRGIRRFLFRLVEVAGLAFAVIAQTRRRRGDGKNLFVFLVFSFSALLVKCASWVSDTCM